MCVDLLIKELSKAIENNTYKNISDALFNKIREMILSGELNVGFTFPNEAALCKELNIGRGALREAYKALDMIGFINRSKSGTSVNDKEKLTQDVSFNMTIEKSGIKDLYEFRMMLEAETAAYAAKRSTKKDILDLTRVQKDITENKMDKRKMAYYDTLFHLLIAQASQNKLLTDMMRTASTTFEKGSYHTFCKVNEEELERVINCHEHIIESIVSGDVELARKTMREHVIYAAKIAGVYEE
ncbi:FCD domain-containing protein [Clostridium bovifaecis]|uniref:FCD domain-containing protein n=1 Tax=Clostridium bovifaecis TaxID=2184719 RepID=A0A6I6ENU0_9CLOT|nr:FCD domain-containing protein [Clostridium bovifaecis]